MAQVCSDIVTNNWPIDGINFSRQTDTFRQTAVGASKLADDFSITKMYVYLKTAPGAGKKRRFTLYKNGSPTGLYLTISNTDTTGNASFTVNFNSNFTDNLSVVEELFDAATESEFSFSLLLKSSEDKQIIFSYDKEDELNEALTGLPLIKYRALLSGKWFSGSDLESTSSIFTSAGKLKNYKAKVETNTLETQPNTGNGFFPAAPTESVKFHVNLHNEDKTLDEQKEFLEFTGSSTSESNTSDELVIDQGQLLQVELERSDSDHNFLNIFTIKEFHPDNAGERVMSATARVAGGGGTYYHPGSGDSLDPLGETTESFIVVPTSGTIKNLFINALSGGPGAGDPVTVTMRKNGSDTALTVTLSNPDDFDKDVANSFTVVAGDRLSIKCVSTANIAFRLGWTFVVDNVLETPLFSTRGAEDIPSTNSSVEVCVNQGFTDTSYCAYVSGGEVRKMVNEVFGLDHLEGETVEVQTDGAIPSSNGFVVSGGQITLTDKAAVIHAGLPYDGTLKLLKTSDGSAQGTGQTKMRRVYLSVLRLYKSLGLKVGINDDDLLAIFDTDPALPLFTGDQDKLPDTSHDNEVEFVIKQEDPLPAFILAVILRSEVEEK